MVVTEPQAHPPRPQIDYVARWEQVRRKKEKEKSEAVQRELTRRTLVSVSPEIEKYKQDRLKGDQYKWPYCRFDKKPKLDTHTIS